MDDSGRTCTDLIESISTEIRDNQEAKPKSTFVKKNNNKPTSFRGLSFLDKKVS